jgi:hypothetical protein
LLKIDIVTWTCGCNKSYLVAIRLVLFPSYWVWCQIQLFIENLCKLHEKMVEICPIWWPPYVFWFPFMYWIKSRIKVKVWN